MNRATYRPEIDQHPLTLTLDTLPALESHVETPQWSARTAARMTVLMGKYWKSQQAVLAQGFAKMSSGAGFSPTWSATPDLVREIQPFISNWKSGDLITVLADDGFANMMQAAALKAPETPLFSDELISPHGALYFENVQDLSELPCGTPNIRSIAWSSSPTGEHSRLVVMIASVMTEDEKNHWKKVNPRHFYPRIFPYLKPHFYAFNMIDAPMINANAGTTAAFGLVRSISAIIASDQTNQQIVAAPPPQKPKKANKRSGKPVRDPKVRVVSLVNHDHGRYQLDAVTGHKMRAHWVRGHWRKQWYPATEEHRTIWIDGFVKGDAKLGRVNSAKVHTARTSRP